MRPYRGIPIDGKDFVYGWYNHHENKDWISDWDKGFPRVLPDGEIGNTWMVEVIPETVSQQTGLKDKNGTDLDWWEGDIFEHPSGLCVIKWYEGGLYMHGSGGFIQVGHAAGWVVLPAKIGNIHQHPKLLPDSRNICLECGADICSICGACLTEHNEDPVNNCPEQSIHRTTKLTQREQNNG